MSTSGVGAIGLTGVVGGAGYQPARPPPGAPSRATPEAKGDNSTQGQPPPTPLELTAQEEKVVQALERRDREVRQHERAHATAGGPYAGMPSYDTQRGPDGKSYAVGGETPIDVSKENDPEATIRKMDQIIRAALAPAEPSSQDRAIAAQARARKAEAQSELRQAEAESLRGGDQAAPGPGYDASGRVGQADGARSLVGAALDIEA